MAERRYRWAAAAVSALGILGFSLSALYVFAVAMSFHPRGAKISKIMVGSHAGEFGWALVLAAVPYLLMVTYLFVRTRFGHWLVERGALVEALEYVKGKQSASLLRSKLEATSHRTAALKAHMKRGEYDEARDVAGRLTIEKLRNPVVLEAAFWRATHALRRDDLVDAHRVLDDLAAKKRAAVGDLLTLRAELLAREGDKEGWRGAKERAKWARARPHRLAWANAVGVAKFGLVGEANDALEGLEEFGEKLDLEVPGRAPERVLIEVKLQKLINSGGNSQAMIAAAQNLRDPDPRSSWLLGSEIG